jgi:hypothetical protein
MTRCRAADCHRAQVRYSPWCGHHFDALLSRAMRAASVATIVVAGVTTTALAEDRQPPDRSDPVATFSPATTPRPTPDRHSPSRTFGPAPTSLPAITTPPTDTVR